MLEKVEKIDGELCQECSLRYARKSRIRELASGVFVKIIRNFIISFLFLIQHNFIISQLSSGAANNISERLSGRKPVSEQSERASGYIVR